MIVSIEGLPGAGKTTCTRLVSAQLGWPAVFEPYDDHPFLGTVYREAIRHNLLVEMQFLLLHFAEFRQLDASSSVVADFAPAKDLVFADLVLEPEEHALFSRMYGHFYTALPSPALTVFIDTPVDECLHRVKVRGREFEKHMKADWLESLREAYLNRLGELGEDVLVIDAPPSSTAQDVALEIVNLVADSQRIDVAEPRLEER